MNLISILIVDDDLNKITLIIKTIKEVFKETLSINQASCVQEAMEYLQKKEFHLLITDLQMPLKYDTNLDNKGGESLIRELYKGKNKANIPLYIVGLTQFEDLKNNYKGVWKIWHFDSSSESWKNNLRDLIYHIGLIKYRIITDKIETVFVEGPTDKKIIETSIKHFYVDYIEKIHIETINFGGGAAWVERQLFIWAKSLSIKSQGKYIKAVGVFDDDEAGNKGIENIRKQILLDSAESKTFSIIKNSHKYSQILKSIKSKGIIFPTTLEDLVGIDCWKAAEKNGWLIPRNLKNVNIDYALLPLSFEDLNIESLHKKNFDDDEILLLTKKVNNEYKIQFCNLACELEGKSLESIKYLLEDIISKLKI